MQRSYVPKVVKPNAPFGERREGHLHPKSYLWVILEKFGGWYGNPPRHLMERYYRACQLWGSAPHTTLVKWEIRRFEHNLARFEELLASHIRSKELDRVQKDELT